MTVKTSLFFFSFLKFFFLILALELLVDGTPRSDIMASTQEEWEEWEYASLTKNNTENEYSVAFDDGIKIYIYKAKNYMFYRHCTHFF